MGTDIGEYRHIPILKSDVANLGNPAACLRASNHCHGLTGCRVFAFVSGNERLNKIDDLLLLPSWKPGSRLKHLSEFAGRNGQPFGFGKSQKLLNSHAEGVGQLWQNLDLRDAVGFLPINDIGMMNAELAGKLPHLQACTFA